MGGLCVMLREDFFRLPVVTLIDTFTEDALFPESRLRDDFDFLPWKPNSATTGTELYRGDLGAPFNEQPDLIFVGGHNLGTEGVTVTVQRSNNDISWIDVASISPTTDDDIFLGAFLSGARRYWGIKLTGVTTATEISEIFLGRRISFPYRNRLRGMDPDGRQISRPTASFYQGAAIELPNNYVARKMRFQFDLVPETFLEDDTQNLSAWKYWLRESGRKGEPFVIDWAFDRPAFIREKSPLFGVLRGFPSSIRRTPVRPDGVGGDLGGSRDLAFMVEGLAI